MRGNRLGKGVPGRTLLRSVEGSIKNVLYVIIYFIVFLPIRALFRMRVKGREMVEAESGYIAVARHRSYWDIPILVVALGWRNRVHFISRKGLSRNLFLNPLIRIFTTAIDREHFSKTDLRRVLAAMSRERIIGFFPEGTTRKRVQSKSGVIHFAKRAKKALLPVNIRASGPYPPHYPFHFPQITVSVGRPFHVSELEVEQNEGRKQPEQYRELSEQLMKQVDAA